MAQTYSSKLKNPLWQKKRLEILNRDNWTCLLCSDTKTELQVHHKEYKRGKEPWEYEDTNFQTLCSHCHLVTELAKECGRTIIVSVKSLPQFYDGVFVESIQQNKDGSLVLSMDKIALPGGAINVSVMSRATLHKLDELFDHAKKLANNGK